jgi:hypothetical protein
VELNSTEDIIVMWEDGLMASERALGRACMERNTKHAYTEVVQ